GCRAVGRRAVGRRAVVARGAGLTLLVLRVVVVVAVHVARHAFARPLGPRAGVRRRIAGLVAKPIAGADADHGRIARALTVAVARAGLRAEALPLELIAGEHHRARSETLRSDALDRLGGGIHDARVGGPAAGVLGDVSVLGRGRVRSAGAADVAR